MNNIRHQSLHFHSSGISQLIHLFFSILILAVVVLMNLLNGLAVSDTAVIREKAEIVTYIIR